ncbi:MAG: helix-turn-helix domain-containing protein [Zetaproteobacteria bacterium]|nr:helix-turn-helix domain-containing protein [Zetaproteobacteria bacterium]
MERESRNILNKGQLPQNQDESIQEKRERCGLALEKLRTEHQISRENIIHLTRISISFVEQIESGKFDLLPGEIFGRGYIRNLCKILDVDPTPYIQQYNSCWPTEASITSPHGGRSTHVQRHYRSKKSPGSSFRSPLRPITKQGKTVLFVATSSLALLAFLIYRPKSVTPTTTVANSIPTATPQKAKKVTDHNLQGNHTPTTPAAPTTPLSDTKLSANNAPSTSTEWTAIQADNIGEVTTATGALKIEAKTNFQLTYSMDSGARIKKSFDAGKYHFSFLRKATLLFSSTKDMQISFNGRSLGEYHPERDRKELIFINQNKIAQEKMPTQQG